MAILAQLGCSHPEPDAELGKDPDEIYPADSFLLAYHNFDGKIAKWYMNSLCCNWSATLSNNIKRAGSHSVKFELRNTDSGHNYRAQLERAPNKNNEGWFGFALYFPESFVYDTVEEGVVQWQALPDFSEGEDWRSPPLFLAVLEDRFVLEVRSDTNRITPVYKYDFLRIDLGPVKKDTWSDWVFHIKWAYDNTGIIEVWKDKELILSRKGMPNSYNDELFPYFKIGIDKWSWKTSTASSVISRTLYVDEVRIGRANAGFSKVNPGRN